jgi:hypothetical protein
MQISNYGNGFFVISNGKELRLRNNFSNNVIPFPEEERREKEILLRVAKNNFKRLEENNN